MFRVHIRYAKGAVTNLCASQCSQVVPKRSKVLSLDNMNPSVKLMEYAVRGPIVIRAAEIAKELQAGSTKKFSEVIKANIGDCHATGQKPVTFIRQILALCTYPKLFEDPSFPADTKQRAQRILDACGGKSLGSYSDSPGLNVILQDVAKYITQRDGYPSDPDNIFLTNGASEAIKIVLKLMMTGEHGTKRAGVMIPIPQYPLYTATIAEFNALGINYYLDESTNWSLDISDLKRAIDAARKECIPKAIVVINPGNPTGQVLSRQNIEDVIRFAKQENLFILADEVYQHNVYSNDREFQSFKRVLSEMGGEVADQELASFMSVSKGYMGECGLRGGYCELINMDAAVKAQMLKSITASLCSSLHGQVTIDTVVNPPEANEPSYELFMQEKSTVLSELKQKAQIVREGISSIEGMTCCEVQGAMYAFPCIDLPQAAINEAKSKGMAPDALYCFELLEHTGICVVPGSGFGQRDGTYHFRMTILPSVDQLQSMMGKIGQFHESFLRKYSSDSVSKHA